MKEDFLIREAKNQWNKKAEYGWFPSHEHESDVMDTMTESSSHYGSASCKCYDDDEEFYDGDTLGDSRCGDCGIKLRLCDCNYLCVPTAITEHYFPSQTEFGLDEHRLEGSLTRDTLLQTYAGQSQRVQSDYLDLSYQMPQDCSRTTLAFESGTEWCSCQTLSESIFPIFDIPGSHGRANPAAGELVEQECACWSIPLDEERLLV